MKLKIKPTKNTVALRKLKFRKESDFNKFLNIVSKNTKELQRIKLPSKSDVKKKSSLNLLPLLALGALIAALAGKKKGDTDGVDGGGVDDTTLSVADKTDSTSNVLMKGISSINNTRNDKKNTRKIDLGKKSRRKKRLLRRIRKKRKIDLKNKRKIKTKTKTKIGKNDPSRWREEVKNNTKRIRKIANQTLKTTKVITSAVTKNPASLAATVIVSDITKGHGLSEEEWNAGPGTLEYQRNLEKEQFKNRFKTEASKQKDLINKEIDQLISTRSQLDVSDRRTYQHLTAKIEGLLVKSAAITPKALEQQYITNSSKNPVILYPIDSQNVQPIINAPTSNQPPPSQSQAGNDTVGGESDSVNISELFLLSKLSH